MNQQRHTRLLQGLIHITGWGILFGLPFFFMGKNGTENSLVKYMEFSVVPISFMIVFYANYFYLIDKYLFTKQISKFIIINVILIGCVSLALHFWMETHTPANKGPEMSPRDWHVIVMFYIRDLMAFLLTAGLSVAIKVTGNWYKTDTERRELEKSNSEAELRNLKSQLNPHFLFNTLNNIYSLIAFSPEKAQQAVHDLSKLLRYVLYENNLHFVPLMKELEFIRNYVELMRIRLSEQVDVQVSMPTQRHEEILIAPLLFISLIENAFKHGVSNSKPSFIHIQLDITPDRKIVCFIHNSYFPKTEEDKSGSGIGLTNLYKRLELLYPERHSLQCGREGDSYVAKLVLILNTEEV